MTWAPFLQARGVNPDTAEWSRLTGGLINDMYEVRGPDTHVIVRHYRRTGSAADVTFELAAVDHLATVGFPTPAVIKAADGACFDVVDGRFAAMFAYVAGTRPPSRPGGFGSYDLGLGVELGALLGRLHRTTWGIDFPGARQERGDPMRRIGEFLAAGRNDRRLRAVTGMPAFLDGLERVCGSVPSGLPRGLVHADINESNVLVGDDGRLTALLDFDDCLYSHLVYDLCSLISTWGLDEDRMLDLERGRALVDAYDGVRPLSAAERAHLPLFLLVYLGASGAEYVAGLHRRDAFIHGVTDSYSATTFLALDADRSWAAKLIS